MTAKWLQRWSRLRYTGKEDKKSEEIVMCGGVQQREEGTRSSSWKMVGNRDGYVSNTGSQAQASKLWDIVTGSHKNAIRREGLVPLQPRSMYNSKRRKRATDGRQETIQTINVYTYAITEYLKGGSGISPQDKTSPSQCPETAAFSPLMVALSSRCNGLTVYMLRSKGIGSNAGLKGTRVVPAGEMMRWEVMGYLARRPPPPGLPAKEDGRVFVALTCHHNAIKENTRIYAPSPRNKVNATAAISERVGFVKKIEATFLLLFFTLALFMLPTSINLAPLSIQATDEAPNIPSNPSARVLISSLLTHRLVLIWIDLANASFLRMPFLRRMMDCNRQYPQHVGMHIPSHHPYIALKIFPSNKRFMGELMMATPASPFSKKKEAKAMARLLLSLLS
ncbi:hypothetical protein ACRALDRAFT_2016857 [Sodiomyces alcalophilus JCM 7366]|uniref:uncharacterized protein n=1 Tax=Sodiomyces alcalophilus JCM 7366 TaxID=591952 RepID=UPI0039B462A6